MVVEAEDVHSAETVVHNVHNMTVVNVHKLVDPSCPDIQTQSVITHPVVQSNLNLHVCLQVLQHQKDRVAQADSVLHVQKVTHVARADTDLEQAAQRTVPHHVQLVIHEIVHLPLIVAADLQQVTVHLHVQVENSKIVVQVRTAKSSDMENLPHEHPTKFKRDPIRVSFCLFLIFKIKCKRINAITLPCFRWAIVKDMT